METKPVNPLVPDIPIVPKSGAFVAGVADTLYSVFGEREPARLVEDPRRPWRNQWMLGRVKEETIGRAHFHQFEPGSEEELQYDLGRHFAAQKLEREFGAGEEKEMKTSPKGA